MPNLDPHPLNILGKGILPPDQEAAMIAAGFVFATYLTPAGRKAKPFLLTSRRPYADILNARTKNRTTRTLRPAHA